MAQPDFKVINASMTSLRTAATELDNVSTEVVNKQNMEAANVVNQLNQIQEQILNQIEEQMRRMEQRIQGQIGQMEQRMQGQMGQMEQRILTQMSRCEKNNLARLYNSRISHETHQLEPLYSIGNQIIGDFPSTSADIHALDAAGVERILRELGLPVTGMLSDKKKRLRRHIGLMVL
ncbi:hypothetical protein EV426DRAFT_628376 [Tirmania nivea]|nr:hypothetical protein EV426DRAFT_628376 [Tirmania nivea]